MQKLVAEGIEMTLIYVWQMKPGRETRVCFRLKKSSEVDYKNVSHLG